MRPKTRMYAGLACLFASTTTPLWMALVRELVTSAVLQTGLVHTCLCLGGCLFFVGLVYAASTIGTDL